MSELIQKISAYDLVNTLVPGGMLVYAMRPLGYLGPESTDVFVEVVLAYLLGLVGSRVGSLILEPLAIKFGLIWRDYPAYVAAQKSDKGLVALTTIANMYRALAGSMLVLAVLALGTLVPAAYHVWLLVGYGIAYFALLLLAWLKQDGYVKKRIELCREDNENVNH